MGKYSKKPGGSKAFSIGSFTSSSGSKFKSFLKATGSAVQKAKDAVGLSPGGGAEDAGEAEEGGRDEEQGGGGPGEGGEGRQEESGKPKAKVNNTVVSATKIGCISSGILKRGPETVCANERLHEQSCRERTGRTSTWRIWATGRSALCSLR